MEWIKTLLPLIGVALGWLLSERGKIFADQRQDKRKLKKLLFFLLELRYHFSRELSIELDLDRFIDTMKNKMANRLGIAQNDPELNMGVNVLKPFLLELIKKAKNQDSKFEYLSENIDKVIIELAEVFPVLAYELSGQHNIKERLLNAENYFNEIKSITDDIPFDIKQWVNPKLTKELLDNLDESINKIAHQIDKKTSSLAKIAVSKMTFDVNDNEVEQFIDDYLNNLPQG